MPTPRMLPDTVDLFNYIGEVNDVATYQKAIIHKCYCIIRDSSIPTGNGTAPSNRCTLYIFDRDSKVTDENGNELTYIPFQDWDSLSTKAGYWTLRDGPSRDYFVKTGKFPNPRENPVIGFSHLTAGTPHMRHFEVSGA